MGKYFLAWLLGVPGIVTEGARLRPCGYNARHSLRRVLNKIRRRINVADRRCLTPWLMQMVLAAKAGGLDLLDGVYNDFRDTDGLTRECAEAASRGFDGKTLIHPAQIEAANRAFSPSEAAVKEARAIVAAFALPENAGRGVIALDGRMVERLHLAQAEKLLAKTAAIGA